MEESDHRWIDSVLMSTQSAASFYPVEPRTPEKGVSLLSPFLVLKGQEPQVICRTGISKTFAATKRF